MLNITLSQILGADFRLRPEPVLKPFDGSFVVADPSLLTPETSPDGKFHMFFHTNFAVYDFVSSDGITFSKNAKIVSDAMRPNINKTDDGYCLFYEKTRSVFANLMNFIGIAKWHSEIFALKSKDLVHWSGPQRVLSSAAGYEKFNKGSSISNPFLLSENGKNRLYFSCGLTYIDDCKFCEPTYIFAAESDKLTQGYEVMPKPVISPDKNDPYLNLCSGCLKVYRLKDGYLGIQNGIYSKDGKSHSAILMLSSADGLDFKFEKLLLEPGGAPWLAQFVYASHLIEYGNKLRLYFNARDTSNPVRGRECIGFIEADITEAQ